MWRAPAPESWPHDARTVSLFDAPPGFDEAMIANKREQVVGTAPASEPATAARPALDIPEALKKSMAMVRKPAAPDVQPPRKTPGRVTEIKSKRPSRKAR